MTKNLVFRDNNLMITRFFIYGVTGWCMEIIWTAMASLQKKDYRLMGNTSLWMFVIYGMMIFLEPVYDLLKDVPFYFRGGIYVVCIFAGEYLTGGLLKRANICPWDYSGAKYSVKGVIRLDYAPAWFAAGLIFEGVYFLLKY